MEHEDTIEVEAIFLMKENYITECDARFHVTVYFENMASDIYVLTFFVKGIYRTKLIALK